MRRPFCTKYSFATVRASAGPSLCAHTKGGRRIHLQPSPEGLHTVLQQRLQPEQVCCLEHLSLQHLPSRRFLLIPLRFPPIPPRTNAALALSPPNPCTSPSLPTLRQLSRVQVPQHHPERPRAHFTPAPPPRATRRTLGG